jgi:hypothetical protein
VDRDAAVRVELYRQLVERRRAPTHVEVGKALGLPDAEAAETFRRLAEAHMIVLRPGTLELWMAAPLSAVETPFLVQTERGDLYGNCVWDAFGVLAMLGVDGTVRTSCADCEEPLELGLRGGEIHGEAVAHFLVPAAHWWDDIGHT